MKIQFNVPTLKKMLLSNSNTLTSNNLIFTHYCTFGILIARFSCVCCTKIRSLLIVFKNIKTLLHLMVTVVQGDTNLSKKSYQVKYR